jgi:molecular chaperone DnaK (HSP70)
VSPPRAVVGIDLGTTNTAVAFATLAEGGVASRVQILEVAQLVAPGELGARAQLPSFLYLAGDHDLAAAATAVPWDPTRRNVVGELARQQGARVPDRMIASAKSWLCHPDVDRMAAILPWGAGDGPKRSPVEVSAAILAHVADAWRHRFGSALADQDVVVTVPASFDEAARELTVLAAETAGLPHVTLLEEPQAVFYAWIDAHPAAARRAALAAGETVLVCDVGGGTTDFTLIKVGADGDSFERTAVGDHLLLGGDNIDIALARQVEGRLGSLDAIQWHGLVHACRLAKEQLLSDASLQARPITVQARGAKLLGGTLRTELTRAEVETLVMDGFWPLVAADARPARARAGLHEFGLPYAQDAAITRHLAAFLRRHGAPRIDAVLFNGGAMKPEMVRRRVLEQLAAWQPDQAAPRELAGAEPDLAVARGAASYGLVRRGIGSRIRGGAARAFYVGVHGGGAVCVLPRGAEEGTERELAEDFVVLCNRPASFRLYTASTRTDRPGDDVHPGEAAADEIVELPPLVTVLRAPGRSEVRVHVVARLTEVGTLELWCHEASAPGEGTSASQHRFRLSFDLRGAGGGRSASTGADDDGDRDEPPLDPPAPEGEAGKALVAAAFGGAPGAPPVASLMKELERVMLARRDEWSTSTCRALWDGLHQVMAAREQCAEAEARWLHLAGFLLRPGVGAPLDSWRGQEMWKLWNAGLRHDREEQCKLAWWIVWRRIAAGLKRTQQDQIYDRLAPLFLPGAQQKARWFKIKPSPQEVGEMWRVLGALERLGVQSKTKLGDALVERLVAGKDLEVGWWAIGRLGARALLYGPRDTVVGPEVAARWIDRLLAVPWPQPDRVCFPLAQIGRRTGDRSRDLDDAVRARLAARLSATPGGERAARLVEDIVALEAREERVAFGDSLPSGLRKLASTTTPPPLGEPGPTSDPNPDHSATG